MNLAFPFHLQSGRVAADTYEEHVRQLIEQVLFTAPGQRVNRPAFGCDVMNLVFTPQRPDLITTAQIKGSLDRWLKDVISTISVEANTDVAGGPADLEITIEYVVLKTGGQRRHAFRRDQGGRAAAPESRVLAGPRRE